MGGLPSNFESIKGAIFAFLAIVAFLAFNNNIHSLELPFLGVGQVPINVFQITLLCLSLYLITTFTIEWFKFEKDIRQKKAWLADLLLTLLAGLLCIGFLTYKLFIYEFPVKAGL
jgi:hypothetical protein